MSKDKTTGNLIAKFIGVTLGFCLNAVLTVYLGTAILGYFGIVL